MKSLADGSLRFVRVTTLIAGVSALAGFLVTHFAGLGTTGAQGAGWGMCIGGALIALVTGQSGSPTQMAVRGRWGTFGQFWGQNPALPQSPLWVLGSSIIVFAGGIALVALTY